MNLLVLVVVPLLLMWTFVGACAAHYVGSFPWRWSLTKRALFVFACGPLVWLIGASVLLADFFTDNDWLDEK